MELTDLKVFLAVAEEGSVSGAARRLDYVQSNVTTRLRKLESELGAPLFHRHPKGVVLSERGVIFREYALKILQLADDAVKAVRETEEPRGTLAIGVVETVASAGLLRVLSDFQTRYPQVSLSLVTGTSPSLREKVLNYELDGAFVTGDTGSPLLIPEYEIRDVVGLVTGIGSGDAPDLSRATWVVFPPGCPFRALTEAWLESEGSKPAQVIETATLETMLGCVRSGLGATLLPVSSLPKEDGQLRVLPVPEAYRYMTTRLVRRKDRFVSKAFTAFVERLRAHGFGVREGEAGDGDHAGLAG
jgi:DNA-binding transcriptional LysR family regulator